MVEKKKASKKVKKTYKTIADFNFEGVVYYIDQPLPDFPDEVIQMLVKAKAIE